MTDYEQRLHALDHQAWPDPTAPWREAAVDILVQLERECLRRLDTAWEDVCPDRGAIEFWTEIAARCRVERRRLRPEDAVDVACEYGLLLCAARQL
jgi:hypothetical protein